MLAACIRDVAVIIHHSSEYMYWHTAEANIEIGVQRQRETEKATVFSKLIAFRIFLRWQSRYIHMAGVESRPGAKS